MNVRLFFQAILKFIVGAAVIGALIFVPAGTFDFPQGWLLMGILFIPMFCAGIVMMFRSPELLAKRLNAREREKDQRVVLALSGIMFIAAFVVAGLNYRFGWVKMPFWACCVAAVFFLLAYLMYAEVLRENVYLSRTVEVQQGQKVIDTGLYGVVRHPMYSATLVLFLSMGLVLGSPISFCILLLYVPIIAMRIRNEEAVLAGGLPGYTEYMERVRYRLVPFIW